MHHRGDLKAQHTHRRYHQDRPSEQDQASWKRTWKAHALCRVWHRDSRECLLVRQGVEDYAPQRSAGLVPTADYVHGVAHYFWPLIRSRHLCSDLNPNPITVVHLNPNLTVGTTKTPCYHRGGQGGT